MLPISYSLTDGTDLNELIYGAVYNNSSKAC